MEKTAIFFDIDGTVWDWSRNIPESTVKAIKLLKEKGHKVLICSGRAKGNLRDKNLTDLNFDGIVAACGAYVEIGGKVIHEEDIPPHIVKETVEAIIKYKMPSVLEGPVKHWVSEWGFEKDDFVHHMRAVMKEDAVPLRAYSDDMKINKFAADVLAMTDYASLKAQLTKYYDFIEHGLTPDLDPDQGQDPYAIRGVIEAVPKGINKANGVRMACEYMGIAPENAFAFGDSANDIEMLTAVGTGIAMGNGTDSIKKAADYVTDDIMHDGIYNALVHFGLI